MQRLGGAGRRLHCGFCEPDWIILLLKRAPPIAVSPRVSNISATVWLLIQQRPNCLSPCADEVLVEKLDVGLVARLHDDAVLERRLPRRDGLALLHHHLS
jgi:hypothetical protein